MRHFDMRILLIVLIVLLVVRLDFSREPEGTFWFAIQFPRCELFYADIPFITIFHNGYNPPLRGWYLTVGPNLGHESTSWCG